MIINIIICNVDGCFFVVVVVAVIVTDLVVFDMMVSRLFDVFMH